MSTRAKIICVLLIAAAIIVGIVLYRNKTRENLLDMIEETKDFFGNLLSGRQVMRNDSEGHGHFGASRGSRKHKGVDLVVIPGATVYSPINGKVVRAVKPYADDDVLSGILIDGTGEHEGFQFKILYIKPDAVLIGNSVTKGQRIGIAQAVSRKHGAAMTDHIHVEFIAMGQLADPTKFLIQQA